MTLSKDEGGYDLCMKNAIVLVDQDGPLADYRAGICRILESLGEDPARFKMQTSSTREDLLLAYGQEIADKVDLERNLPGFYDSLEVVRGASVGIKSLLSFGAIPVVCTKPRRENPTCASEKTSWLDRNFPEFEGRYILASDKTLVVGKILIDDKFSITGLVRPSWTHVYFGSRLNVGDEQVPVINSWDEIHIISDLI